MGTSKEDILVAGRGKGERLYGGAGDDLLASIDGGDYAHGGSGADIFAFRFNKNIRRSAKRGKTVDHVIEDFNLDEGDSICLSHLVTKSRHKNIDYRGTGRIKGTGIEVRLVQGKKGTAQKEQEAFTGIEDGVEKTIGELPEISKTRRNGVDSRLEVYEDGNLVSNITLKNTPSSRAFSRKLGKAIFGKYSQTSKSVVSAEGANANHLTEFSLTNAGIPFKGNSAKIDIGDHGSSNVSALVQSAAVTDGSVSSSFSEDIDNSMMKVSAHIGFEEYQKFEIFGDFWKGTWPSYKLGVKPSFDINISPKFVFDTGNIAGLGSLSYSPKLGVSASIEVFPGLNAGASGGLGLGGSLSVSKKGLNKKIVISPELSASAKVAFGHNSMWNTRLAFDSSDHSATFLLKESSIDYGQNEAKDGITGVSVTMSVSPAIQFDMGFGYSESNDEISLTADIIQSGPKLTYPFALELIDTEIGIPGRPLALKDASLTYGPAQLDWVTTLGVLSFSDKLDSYSWTGPSYNVGIAEMGESGIIKLPFL